MDSFELNKIIGAILGTLLFVMGVGFLAEAVYHPIEDRGPGYALPEPEEGGAAVAEVEEPAVPLAVLLASANAEQGQAAARKCTSCHNFEKGAGNKQGPELYGVVGRVIGSHEGFAYSDAMLAHHDAGDTWTYENLDHFLLAPKDFVPGTKMNFGGVKNDEERANILAFLQTLSDDPVPFPEPEAEAPAEDEAAAPAEDAAAEDAAAEDMADESMAEDAEDAGIDPEAIAPADEDAEPVSTEADAVETPTETDAETPVEGTPVTETTAEPEAAAPAETDTTGN